MKKWIISAAVAIVAMSSYTHADNITIYDEDGYLGSGVGREDNETEPNMINNQNWDLEAFTLEGNELGIVGGFDLRDGYNYGGYLYELGDIFIDINGDAQYGTGAHRRQLDPFRENLGYDYAIKLTYTGDEGGTYNVYDLTVASVLTSVIVDKNIPESNPYTLTVTNELSVWNGAFSYTDFNTDENLVDGYASNAITGIDLGFLGDATFIAHTTMDCGNDNLMGRGTTTAVPEPSSIGMLLVGMSLLSLVARKKNR